MNLGEDSWPEYVQSWCDRALTYVDDAGFSENDIEALTCASRSELINDSWHRENLSRPPSASDIAMVRLIHTGKLILKILAMENEDKNIKMAYMFGQDVIFAGAYLELAPAEARFFDKPSTFGELLRNTSDAAKKEIYRSTRQKEGMASRKAKEQEKIEKRNALLCKTAQRFRAENNVADHNLADRTWKTWSYQGYWKRYSYKEISVKQVRKILRDGGVLPPAKTKKRK